MPYTATEWSDGDQVTSAKLNKLEGGFSGMGYTPNTWEAGDVVSAEKLNALEAAASDVNQFIELIKGTVEEFTITEEMGYEYSGDFYLELGVRLLFNNCMSLSKINGLELVSSVCSGSFVGTSALKSLDLPKATSIGENNTGKTVFGGSGIEELSVGSAQSFGDYALSGANDLKYVYAPKAKTISTSFQGLSKLERVYIGADCTSINAAAFGGAGTSGQGLVIDCGFAEGAVSGAPWGASNATINYSVPDPGSLEAMKSASS